MKDLWTLRLQKLYARGDDNYQSDDNGSQVFSSQTERTELDDEEYSYHKRKLSDSPGVIDALALCYLGTLLLRIPVSVGFILRFPQHRISASIVKLNADINAVQMDYQR